MDLIEGDPLQTTEELQYLIDQMREDTLTIVLDQQSVFSHHKGRRVKLGLRGKVKWGTVADGASFFLRHALPKILRENDQIDSVEMEGQYLLLILMIKGEVVPVFIRHPVVH